MSIMDGSVREALLNTLWNEKRGKLVTDDIYPLGVTIALDKPPAHLHFIVWGLLSLLRESPQQAVIWSQHWGRTTVSVSPFQSISFRFTERNTSEEKICPEIHSSKKLDPKLFLVNKHNIGMYKILLNHMPLTLESIVLQVERMVDETVWCVYQTMFDAGNTTNVNVPAYLAAVNRVWNSGIQINYISEDNILKLRTSNTQVPVRLYGTPTARAFIPRVLGAVVFPTNNPSIAVPKVNESRETCLKLLDKGGAIRKATYPLDINDVRYELNHPPVCVGLTLAKKPHLGNILHILYADLLRNELESKYPLVIESNDVGNRIDKMVERLSEILGVSVLETYKRLRDEVVSPDVIDRAYRERDLCTEPKDDSVQNYSSNEPLLLRMHTAFRAILNSLGLLETIIMPDAVTEKYAFGIKRRLASQWDGLGFSSVRYTHGGKHKVMVLENKGRITSHLSRAGFVVSLINHFSIGNNRPILYVDGDASVSHAKEVLALYDNTPVITCEGCGLGYRGNITSGTDGAAPTTQDLARELMLESTNGELTKNLSDTLSFMLVTRYATAPAVNGKQNGLSFFDYWNNEALILDIRRAESELNKFRSKVAATFKLINKNDIRTTGNVDHPDNIKRLLQSIDDYISKRSLARILLKPEVWVIDRPAARLLDWLAHYHRLDNFSAVLHKFMEVVWTKEISRDDAEIALRAMGVIDKPIPSSIGGSLAYYPLLDLHKRGYPFDDAMKMGMDYLQGKLCLVKKRLLSFDLLNRILSMFTEYTSFSDEELKVITSVLKDCISRLPFIGKEVLGNEYR